MSKIPILPDAGIKQKDNHELRKQRFGKYPNLY